MCQKKEAAPARAAQRNSLSNSHLIATDRGGHMSKALKIPADINERSRFEQALLFRNQGCIIHPLYGPQTEGDSPGKRPKLRMQERTRITDEQFFEHFGNGSGDNIGMVPSGGHVVVDLDSKFDQGATVLAFLQQHPILQSVPQERTAGGAHLHFIIENLPTFYHEGKIWKKALEEENLFQGMSAELYFQAPHNVVIAPLAIIWVGLKTPTQD